MKIKFRISVMAMMAMSLGTNAQVRDLEYYVNVKDKGKNADLRYKLNSKVAISSFNTKNSANDILYLNRDWSRAESSHSDFNKVRIYNAESVYDFNLYDDNRNADLRYKLNSKVAVSSFKTKTSANDILYLNRDWSSAKSWHSDFEKISMFGNVGIGTTDTKGYKLAVSGKIITEEIKVALHSNWPDYVFNKSYQLPTLSEVENHIKEKGHLKDIPSAKEIKKNGFFLGEMDAKLLQKIEELTLYTIAQQKEIEKQSEKIKIVEKENKKLTLLNEKIIELQIRFENFESKAKKNDL